LDRDAVITNLDVDAGLALLIIHVSNDEDARCKQGDDQVKSVTIHFDLPFARADWLARSFVAYKLTSNGKFDASSSGGMGLDLDLCWQP
jgi:hypothetical protein